ncbi:MAG: hypothetical protein RL093_1012 [Pseudomonadota bacterium]|jgi:hypothetical protein
MTSGAMVGSERTCTRPPLVMPRDEMAFRRRYEPLLFDRTLTTVFRPGDRRWPNWRGYRQGEIVTARVIARPGSDALGIPPEFTSTRIPIEIVDIGVFAPEALTGGDFAGSSPDVQDTGSLLVHLLGIYGRPLSDFGDVVTRIQFAYRNRG